MIDVHSHFVPPSLASAPSSAPVHLVRRGAISVLRSAEGERPIGESYWDPEARLEAMNRAGVALQVFSALPQMFVDAAAEGAAGDHCRRVNDGYAEVVSDHPGRFTALGILPCGDLAASHRELDRLAELGLAGVGLSAPVVTAWMTSADAGGREVMAHARDRNLAIFVHACGDLGGPPVAPIGELPLTVARAAVAVLLGELVQPGEGWRVAFSHGGGLGVAHARRLDWAWARRPGASDCRPSERARLLFFDSVVFDRRSLDLVRAIAGEARLLYGSDFPTLTYDEDGGLLASGALAGAEVAARSFLGMDLPAPIDDGYHNHNIGVGGKSGEHCGRGSAG